MDSSINQAPVDSRFTPTQNPQAPGGQQLAAPSQTLQTGTGPFDGTSQATITQVGSSRFTPVTLGTNTTQLTVEKAAPAERPYPVLMIGGTIILLCFFVTWLISKQAKNLRAY